MGVWSSLQKSSLQRQAKMVAEPSSVMSLWAQAGPGTRGEEMEPRRTRVGKHSLRVAVSVGDFLQVYIRQASSLRQVCTWAGAVLLNWSHLLLGLRREPHE